jgi:hypothetical protein
MNNQMNNDFIFYQKSLVDDICQKHIENSYVVKIIFGKPNLGSIEFSKHFNRKTLPPSIFGGKISRKDN